MRFYELTKLWRVPIHAKESDKIPDKLEIKYEKSVSSMPLPKFNSEMEIKAHIKELIRPLKASGYVKSFRVKMDSRMIGSRNARLIFRFSD